MRIGLISTYTHPFALGLRYVSSYLKTMGHDVSVCFMSSHRDTTAPDFSAAALADLVERLRPCALIGLSLMTNTFRRAQFLTEHLRNAGLRAPIVWGGTHPTVAPEECLEIADAVCVGEGEEAALQLAERFEAGRDPTGVAGWWFRAGGAFGNAQAIRNALGPLETRLDDLPFPDYELDTHWVGERQGLVPATPANLRGALHTLRVLTARGCPYHCAFCNNAALRRIHEGCGRWVRTRSLENVLAEIRLARRCFPMIRAINFVDDLFLVRSAAEITSFAAQYTAEIGLPLQLDVFPNTVTEAKIAALARLPIELVSMGVESASADTLQNIYQRPTSPQRIAQAVDTLARHRVRTEYHYIVSNPYEPEQNVIETMRFIASHHRGRAVLRVFPLMFYPSTPLYERARRDGLIGARHGFAYDRMGSGALQFAGHDYLGIWLRVVLNLRNIGMPRWLCRRVIDVVVSRPVRAVLDHDWFCPAVFIGYQAARKLVRNCLSQPFIKPLRYVRWPRRAHIMPSGAWRVPRPNAAALRRRASAAPIPSGLSHWGPRGTEIGIVAP